MGKTILALGLLFGVLLFIGMPKMDSHKVDYAPSALDSILAFLSGNTQADNALKIQLKQLDNADSAADRASVERRLSSFFDLLRFVTGLLAIVGAGWLLLHYGMPYLRERQQLEAQAAAYAAWLGITSARIELDVLGRAWVVDHNENAWEVPKQLPAECKQLEDRYGRQ